VVIHWTFVVKPQRESIKYYREGTASVKLFFLNWVDASHWISKQLHILDSQNYFVGIEIYMILECEFAVKYKIQVFPGHDNVTFMCDITLTLNSKSKIKNK